MTQRRGKLLRIHICEQDRYEARLLYEAIVARCQELNLAGATVFRALEGFGETSEIHRHHMLGHDQPIVITVIDSPDKIDQALPELRELAKGGVIVVSDVDIVFARSEGATQETGS